MCCPTQVSSTSPVALGRSKCQAFGLYWLALVTLLVGSLWGNPALAQPADDVVLALADQVLDIPVADLLVNDAVAPGGAIYGIEITQYPIRGALTWSSEGPSLRFDARHEGEAFHGWERFAYRLVGKGVSNDEATVRLDVRPRWSPLSGRWLGLAASAEQLGFYDAHTARFNLCVIGQDGLEQCLVHGVASEHRLWTPLSADLDGDGLHELMLHDPSQALLVVFAVTASCAEAGEVCLEEIDRRDFGKLGNRALASSTVGGGSQLGLFDPDSGQWWIEAAPGHELPTMFTHDPTGGAGAPMLGDWNGDGRITAGLYDPQTRRIHTQALTESGLWDLFDPTLFGALGRVVVTAGGAEVGSGCQQKVLLFEPETSTTHQYFLSKCFSGQVYSGVPTDPSGGGDWPPN